MKKLFVILCIVPLIISTVMSPNAYAANSTLSKKMIVIFAEGKVNKDIVLNVKGAISKEFKNINALAVTLPDDNSISALAHAPGVIKIEPDFVFTASGKPTPVPPPVIQGQTTDWGVTRVKAPTAWTNGNTGLDVNIAVLDTGIGPHPDLTIVDGVTITNGVAIAGSPYVDDNGHGTHVAGIIAAMKNDIGVVGVAPKANLYAVKVLDSSGSGYVSDIVAGIDWAIDHNINIINMSLGSSSYSSLLKEEVDMAYSKGILLVAAAGNSGTKRTTIDNVEYPAKFESVIAAAATDVNNFRASFSSTGTEVEVSAPGVNIKSTYLNNSYATMSGTSMATPMVAGDLALLKQANPALNNIEIRNLLDNQPADQRVIDLGTAGRDNVYGYGLIQAR